MTMSRELGNRGVSFTPIVAGKQVFRDVPLEFRNGTVVQNKH